LASRWHKAFGELALDGDLLLSALPLAEKKDIQKFVKNTGATVLPSQGRSHIHVPKVHCTISDLSGVFGEALLFDAPTILAAPLEPTVWANDLAPAKWVLTNTVPECTPENLVEAVRERIGKRIPAQNRLAESRLGKVDGMATQRATEDIISLLSDTVAVHVES